MITSFANKYKVHNLMNTKRNELCPCGSGKKYKKCCGLRDAKNKQQSRDLFKIGSPVRSGETMVDLAKRLIKVIESEETIVPPSLIPDSNASTEESANPQLIPPTAAKT